MKTLLLLFGLILCSLNTFSQDADSYHLYQFKIENITNHGDAKLMISDMRSIINETIFYFDDETDVFTLKTRTVYSDDNEFITILIDNYFQAISAE